MLTTIEYNEIMSNKRLLEQQRVAIITTGREAQATIENCRAQVAAIDARMVLYTNYLSDAIKEYQDAHPPEPVEPVER